jgi:hypothetical protein
MNPRHFSQNREENSDGPDDPVHLEPTDLSKVDPADYAKHEGEPLALPAILFTYAQTHGWPNSPDTCDVLENTVEQHYGLAGSGYGASWDIRTHTARLVKL